MRKTAFLPWFALAATAGALSVGLSREDGAFVDPDEGLRAKRGSEVRASVVSAKPPAGETVAPAAPAGSSFSPQVRLGFTNGDQWEPAIAVDDYGHVYMLYPQYFGVPGCATCASPTMILQVSADGGATWGAPRTIGTPTTPQWDAQIVVDPVDGRTVFAAWMQNNKSDIIVAKSGDFGATWSMVTADATNSATDKPALAVRGQHVYIGYNHTQTVYVASSHDGGATFTEMKINPNGKLGWSLAGGAAVGPDGAVYMGWAGYKQNGGAKGAVNLYVSRSGDGGVTWTNTLLDVSGAPPDCSAYACGWAYLGAQVVIAIDDAGTLYALWNAGAVDKAPERIYFAKSSNGINWSPRQALSTAPNGVNHNFPAVAARGNGDVRVLWMDDRQGGWWNTYHRRSTDGGATFGAETDISTPVSGLSYITASGFRYPFGDYFEADLDPQGTLHVIMGEGYSYDSPGSIWYVRGQ